MEKDRYAVDCRDAPGSKCSLRITGTKDEVLRTAVKHAVAEHGYPDNDETRAKIQGLIKQDLKETA